MYSKVVLLETDVPRFSARKIILLALPSPMIRGEPGWGRVNSGDGIIKEEGARVEGAKRTSAQCLWGFDAKL